ncbi:ABC transporter permease [Amycolatopsis antarctica]|uniref:ABC transporter permease n=2 Tax=Amycolatopsis antarctica TaxID=1854586 RepID=A0A263D6Y7_9PSEU|nr:ABC transporter permease [Amycolatopsis antarctica]
MLITAFGIILESGLGPGVAAQRYTGAPVMVGGNQTLEVTIDDKSKEKSLPEQTTVPAERVRELEGVDGVQRVIGEVGFPAHVVTGQDDPAAAADGRTSLGHNWSAAALTPYDLREGAPPARPGEVVLDAELAEAAGVPVGGRVAVMTTGAVQRYRLTGIAEMREAEDTPRQATLFFSDAEAGEIAGRGGAVDAVGLLARPDTDPDELAERVEERLEGTGLVVYSGDDRGSLEFHDVAGARGDLTELSGALGGVVIMIAVMVVSSTLALTVHQRRRELALLRAVAATPKQIYRMIAGEALIISVVASVIGCLPGVLAAQVLRWALTLVGVVPEDFEFSYGPVPMLVAVAICVLAAELAAWGVARKAVAIKPIEALGDSATETPKLGGARTGIGIFLFLLGTCASLLPLFFGSIFAVAGAGSGALIMVISILLLGPPVVTAATKLLAGRVRNWFGVHGFLAVANILANSRRLATGIGPLVLAIGFASVQLFIPTTTAAAAEDEATDGTLSNYTITSSTGGISPTAVEDVLAAEGVEAATAVVRTQLYASTSLLDSPEVFDYQVQGVSPAGLERNLDLGVTSGSVRDLGRDTVAISGGAASTLGVSTGQPIQLHYPDGTHARPTVAAIYDRGLGFGDVTVPLDTLREHSSRVLDDTILVRSTPGADGEALTARLQDLAKRYPGLEVLDETGLSAAQQEQASASTFTSAIPLMLVFGYIAIAVANTLVMTTLSRVREFALLRLVGMTSGQVLRMMRAEASTAVVIAVVIGSLVPLLPLVTVSIGLTGSPIPSIPLWMYLGIVGLTSLVGFLSIMLPAKLALRSRPVDAIGLRE